MKSTYLDTDFPAELDKTDCRLDGPEAVGMVHALCGEEEVLHVDYY